MKSKWVPDDRFGAYWLLPDELGLGSRDAATGRSPLGKPQGRRCSDAIKHPRMRHPAEAQSRG